MVFPLSYVTYAPDKIAEITKAASIFSEYGQIYRGQFLRAEEELGAHLFRIDQASGFPNLTKYQLLGPLQSRDIVKNA